MNNIKKDKKALSGSVSIITPTNKKYNIDNIFDNYARQNYQNKELIIILNKNDLSLEAYRKKSLNYTNVSIFQLDENKSLGACRNFGISMARYEYIANFDDDDYYSPYYLTNGIGILNSVEVDIIGKFTSFVYFKSSKLLTIYKPGNENKFSYNLFDGSLIMKKSIFDKIRYSNRTYLVEKEFLKRCYERNVKIYASDKYDYVIVRDSDLDNHTWKIEDDRLFKYCQFYAQTNDFSDLIVRPT
ncbi:glycosyltransferase [Fervidicella metallireducens AeB]|uniref:Glycosyltransferase n=1 Tax=Fervidicella metallireducens AeB TaxID=1403537 RepID=A0A017RXN6_9CLOT|nr:glycosyltransferase family 2 protein [Fervidicella metallireducens]EYE89442.1 glycosyltransferase [Fervidicella metallireducens AeB]